MDITTPISTFQNIPENGKTAALVTLNKELQQQMSSDFKLLRSGSLKDGSAIDLTALNSSYVQNAISSCASDLARGSHLVAKMF